MNASLTLTEFLENTGATLDFYDVGRRVSTISRDDFLAFEKTELSYPFPLQKKSLACCFTAAADLSERTGDLVHSV